jgi:hypothetical protein
VVDKEEDDPSSEEEEDELGERVGGRGRPGGIDHGRDDEQDEGRGDRIARVEPGPLRVDEVREQEAEEDRHEGERHSD